jgi:hypothetical protein
MLFRDPPAGRYVVDTPSAAYVIEVAPAKRTTLMSGRERTWSWLTRDRTYWLTVTTDDVSWPILAERFEAEQDAHERARSLSAGLIDGTTSISRAPSLRRPLRQTDRDEDRRTSARGDR